MQLSHYQYTNICKHLNKCYATKSILLAGLAFMMSHLLYQTDADELAKALQNPLASLISVPFQGNVDYGIGPNDGNRFTLNIQPAIPYGEGNTAQWGFRAVFTLMFPT